MRTYLGSDQSDIGNDHLAMKGDILYEPPRLTASENYVEFVRSGDIKTVRGVVTGLAPGHSNAIIVEDDEQKQTIEDIGAVILASGFDAAPSISFLSEEILNHLSFDKTSDEFPLELSVHSTINASLPSLGFVGFYRSPYWGVIEMQARFLGKLWSGDAQAEKTLAEDDTVDKMVALRKDPRKAQFPMGDYAYLMESFSSALGIQRQEPESTDRRTGIVLPSRYLYADASPAQKEQAAIALSIIDYIFHASETKGAFVARAIFRSLQGNWKLSRTLISSLSTFPSGTFTGIARFLPRAPTDPAFDNEYLYIEEGDFVTDQKMTFRANRRYAYRYREYEDILSAWFIKPDNNKVVDYLFHDLEILPPAGKGRGWRAKASHLCIADTYDVEYEFVFTGVNIERWRLEYSVKGPNKDYRISGTYTR